MNFNFVSNIGRWFKVEYLQLPKQMFKGLAYLLNIQLHSVREARIKMPVYKQSSRRLSYKIFDEELVLQKLPGVKREAFFIGDEEVRGYAANAINDGPEELLAMASCSQSIFCIQ